MNDSADEIIEMHSKGHRDVHIFQYDDVLLFYPVLPCIEAALSITEKSLVCDATTNWMSKVVFKKQTLIEKLNRGGRVVGCTYQGFLQRVVKAIITNKKTFGFTNMRVADVNNGTFPAPKLDKMFGFRFSQQQLLTDFLSANMSGLIGAPTRWGKSELAGTKVLMYDYSIKTVENIQVGDLLMGPDGKHRKVVALGRGREQAYEIIPNKGEPFRCNESHILSLKVTGGANFGGFQKGDIVNITVKDYLQKSKTFKHVTKLWYAALDFEEKDLPFDPWMVGVWLGDGYSSGQACITKPDKDVQAGIIKWAESLGLLWSYSTNKTENDKLNLRTKEGNRNSKNPLTEIARYCQNNDSGYRRIPREYLTASREQRLELLAGLIDTDGYSNNGMAYEITTKYEGLSEDLCQLCRGLGLRFTRSYTKKTIKSLGFEGWYWRCNISGPLQDIPCRGHKKIHSTAGRVDPTTTGFTVKDIGEQDYYGFELEGPDKLFLHWDHLVTHNTTLIINTLRAFPDLVPVVTAPGVDLVKQLYADIKKAIPTREVKLICSGSYTKYPSDTGITVCSADSLEKCNPGNVDLLLADEPHALVTDNRLRGIMAFTKARRYGYGATLKGRFDGRDALIEGVFGPVICERTYKEAVAEGAICPLEVIFYRLPLPEGVYFRDRNAAYNALLFHNEEMAQLTRRICEEVIPQDWQTMIFVKDEKQADMWLDAVGHEHTIAMAKKLTTKQREEVDRLMKENIIKRCLCTKIYVQGVTFSDVRCLINCEAGGNNTSAIQKPGRLAEIRPNKKCGIVIDFQFEPPAESSQYSSGEAWYAMCRDSQGRRAAYEEKGYGIHEVSSVEELKQVFDTLR